MYEFCEGACRKSHPLTMPFSALFPNLRRISISVSNDPFEGTPTLAILENMAKQAGFDGWKELVKMKERDGLEVVEVEPLWDLASVISAIE
jgi:hypothetical protein